MARRRRKRRPRAGAGSGAPGREKPHEAAAAAPRRPRATRHVEASPRSRPRIEDRPPPLWGSFPLTELLTLAGIALMVWGFLSGPGGEGSARIGAGLLVASIAGLELAVREHVTGFRSHTTLLSGAVGILVIVALGLGAGLETLGFLLLAGAAAFAGSFLLLRGLFRRRSGGLSFR